MPGNAMGERRFMTAEHANSRFSTFFSPPIHALIRAELVNRARRLPAYFHHPDIRQHEHTQMESVWRIDSPGPLRDSRPSERARLARGVSVPGNDHW